MSDQKLFFNDLKAKRESQNLSLEEISDFTKIDIKFLIAIEEGDFGCLPNVYMRLFLRSYCKYISADAEEALNDYEFYTIGSKTESKTFSIPVESDDIDNSIDQKELNLPQVPTAKIVTIAITIIALILTFLLISSIDSNSSPKSDDSNKLNTKESSESLKMVQYSSLPNDRPLTNFDFDADNLIAGNKKKLVVSEPFTFRVEALSKTKINVNSGSIIKNKIMEPGQVEVFPIEDKISYDFWSAQHIKCSLNDIDLTQFFGTEDNSIRGWFTAKDLSLNYNFYKQSL
ncbi:MAG: hypothetical protein CBD21_05260 [bacterium TMED161]|nr:MAG: hypothetical protein CBD21_05260 [bacterium TMED161]|tara:strand:+ start:1822 stop:2682 length:861 start_codon:yes stop_codon:yes gene_type:complete